MLCKEYLFAEPETLTKAPVPPANEELPLLSSGCRIFGRILLPASTSYEERFPTVLMLHGYPGTEANLDVAHALRRAGLATVHFYYRGVWGSHGFYSFSNLIEDTQYMVSFLRKNAREYRIDPERLYLLGYSMGGFAAMNALARQARVSGAVLLSPCDLGSRYLDDPERYQVTIQVQNGGYFNTPNPDYLNYDVTANAKNWRFPRLAPFINPELPIRFIGGSKDDITPSPIHIFPTLKILQERNMDVTYTELPDGHEYIGHRILLTETIFDKIVELDRIVTQRQSEHRENE